MPEGYEQIKQALIDRGMKDDKATKLAAMIWNKRNPDKPVGGKKKKQNA